MSTHTPSAYKGFNLETGDRVLFFLKVGIVALVLLTFGVGSTALFAGAAGAAMSYEWFRMTTAERDFDEPLIGVTLAAGFLPAFFTYAVGAGGGAAIALLGAGFLLLIGPRENGLLVKAALGIAIIGIACTCFVWMRAQPEHGLALTAWIIFVVAATELGGSFYARNLSPDGALTPAEPNELPTGLIASVVCGVVAGVIAGVFYREGNLFWVVLASLGLAIVVLMAGEVTRRIRQSVSTAPSGALFMGRGSVIENFDGLVWASIAAGVVMMVAGPLYGW